MRRAHDEEPTSIDGIELDDTPLPRATKADRLTQLEVRVAALEAQLRPAREETQRLERPSRTEGIIRAVSSASTAPLGTVTPWVLGIIGLVTGALLLLERVLSHSP